MGSQVADPEYNPLEDLHIDEEEEDSGTREPLGNKRLKREHMKECNWRREQNKRRREVGDTYVGKNNKC